VSAVLLAVGGRDVRVGVVPLGTANNIAVDLGLPTGDPEAAVASWDAAGLRRFGLPSVSVPQGPCFVESVGLGLFAGLITESDAADPDQGVERARSRMADLVERAEEFDVEVVADGRAWQERVIGLEAVNIASIGPRVVLAPTARSDDGLLTVVPVRAEDREHLVRALRSGGHLAVTVPSALAPSRSVRVEADGAALHVDDEVVGAGAGPVEVGTDDLVTVAVLAPDRDARPRPVDQG
jgi:diacylglycerol kinase family enzyme